MALITFTLDESVNLTPLPIKVQSSENVKMNRF